MTPQAGSRHWRRPCSARRGTRTSRCALDRWTRDWDDVRTWGVRDRGRWVGTLATDASRLTDPGVDGTTASVASDALTAVTVAATHRRRGLLTKMLTESLHEAKDRGDAVSILHRGRVADLRPVRLRARPPGPPSTPTHTRRAGAAMQPAATGFVRQVEPDELHRVRRGDLRPRACATARWDQPRRHVVVATARHGRLRRRCRTTAARWILHESDDGPDGFLCWRPAATCPSTARSARSRCSQFVAASPTAYRNLFAYLSGMDVDRRGPARRAARSTSRRGG